MSVVAARDAELLRSLIHRIDPGDAGAYNNLGVLYYSKGLHAEAVDAFLSALEVDPRMLTAARNLEVAATQPGACDTRLEALAARIAEDDEDLAARREQVRLLRLIGRSDEAARNCDAILAEFPEDVEALLERGAIERRVGDLRRAQRWLERAHNAAPENPIIRLNLAEVLYHRGSNEQALMQLKGIGGGDSGIADAHLLRGFILGDMGRHEEAAEAAAEAARINPALSSLRANLSIDGGVIDGGVPESAVASVVEGGELAHYGLALAFRQRGYLDGARRELERAAEAGEEARLVAHAMAELDLVDGRSDDAIKRYSDLLAQYEDVARYWCEHGVAMHQSGCVDDAAESYRRALRSDPRYALAYNNLGVALAHAGDSAAAREAFTRAIELDPTLVRARLNLARWYRDNNDLLAAMALLRELTSFHRSDAEAWAELGLVMSGLARQREAQQAFARAVEADPGHAGARYGLADVLAALGDDQGSSREMQNALAISPLRIESKLQLGIDLQRECPEALGNVDLLTNHAMSPLAGTMVSEAAFTSLLREKGRSAEAISDVLLPAERAAREFASAEEFALRGLHGEAVERYQRCITLLKAHLPVSPDIDDLLFRAKLGDARSRCLIGRGYESLDELRELAGAHAGDLEVMALNAAAEAQALLMNAGVSIASTDLARVRVIMQGIISRDDASAAILHFTGDSALSLGDEAFAMLFYRRALAADPSRPTPRVAIARMLIARGAFFPAQLELSAALAAVPEMHDARYEMARVRHLLGNQREALTVLTALLQENPTFVEALVLLGEVLLAAGNTQDARTALRRARAYDPDNVSAIRAEAAVLKVLGRDREAEQRLMQVALL